MPLTGSVYPPASLVSLLRSILRRVRELPGHDPNDPYFVELKRSILNSISLHEGQHQNAA